MDSRFRWNETVFVPEDITTVTRFDPAEEADPGEVGLTRTGVDARNSRFPPHYEEAFGHWGITSMISWADPSRALAGAMLNTCKAFLGRYALPNFRLYALIRKHCPRVQ